MAVFRVLLNLLVILVLPLAGGLPEALAFSLAAGMLLLCLALSGILRQAETSTHGKEGHVLVRADDTDTEPGTSSDDSEPIHAEAHEEGLDLAAIPRSPLLPRP